MMGSSTLGIGLTMFLRDQFSGPASRIRNSSRTMQDEMRRMQEEQLRYTRNLNAGIAMMGVAATRGLTRAIGQSAKFGYEMEFVKSVTAATRSEADALGKQAMRLGQDTMFFAQDVAEGMRYMAMAGMSSQEVTKNIEGAVNLAGATKSLLGGKGGSADIMTNVMKQFQIGFEHTNDVADVLAYGTTRANTNLFDLGEAIKYAGSTSMDLNISLQESVAMVMALGNAGMQGSMAGVAMENAMRYMARAFSKFGSGTSKKALDELGLTLADVTDQKGNLLSMATIMERFGKSLEGMDVINRNSILQTVFGVRGKRASSLLIRDLKNFSQLSGDVSTKSGGHAARIMADMMDTLQGQILRTGSAWQNMWIKFTEAVEPTVKWVLNVAERLFTSLQKLFEVPYLGSMLSTGIMGFIVLRTAIAAYKAVSAGISLINIQNTTSMATYTTSAVAGWNAQTAAALRYQSAARLAGTATKWGGIAAMTKTRTIVGGMSGALAVRGQQFVRAGGRRAGQFVSGAVAMRYAAIYGGRAVAGTVTRGVLGRAIGALGGPVGLALSFVLPAAIGLLTSTLNNNKDVTEKNTAAIQANSRANDPNVRYQGAFVSDDSLGARILTMQMLGGKEAVEKTQVTSGFKDAVEAALTKLATTGKSGDIIINLDGNTIFKSPIESLKNEFRSAGIM